jgi:NAD(P)H dehydrogenase (quinone)
MYAITGITGQVGGNVARALLAEGKGVRAVVRDSRKGVAWREAGCDVMVADMSDADALASAFRDTEGVFVLLPPNFDPAPGFVETKQIVSTLRTALETARPARVVCLSTIGAQASEENLLTQLSLMERGLEDLSTDLTFLRPAWFMENAAWDVAPARDVGVMKSFLQPLDKPVPMVATDDVGRVAAELLLDAPGGSRLVELEGPSRVSPAEVASTFANILGRTVQAEAVPRRDWAKLFASQGIKNPTPRMRMLDGFNDGWIEFVGGEAGSRKGLVPLAVVLEEFVVASHS